MISQSQPRILIRMHNEKRGFLLMEAVIVITALSFFLSISMSRMRSYREHKRHEILCKNHDIIVNAIAAFLSKHNRLPKPSSSISDGRESDAPSGVVPYYDLGISRLNALDGAGKPIYYTPNKDLVRQFKYINYEKENNDVMLDDSTYFCHKMSGNSIKLIFNKKEEPVSSETTIAFTLSSIPPYEKGGFAYVDVSINAFWITRDLLLMRYLKSSPCKCVTTKPIVVANDEDLF